MGGGAAASVAPPCIAMAVLADVVRAFLPRMADSHPWWPTHPMTASMQGKACADAARQDSHGSEEPRDRCGPPPPHADRCGVEAPQQQPGPTQPPSAPSSHCLHPPPPPPPLLPSPAPPPSSTTPPLHISLLLPLLAPLVALPGNISGMQRDQPAGRPFRHFPGRLGRRGWCRCHIGRGAIHCAG